ncbi:MAG: two-component sensor histidine kinase [Rhodocyclaceae bacterium]|nr:two-component sensor histidine kinase [Rhodocyclaceae bacterium]
MMSGFWHRNSGSLQLQLLGATLVFVSAVWLVLSVVAWHEAKSEAEELFDAHLAQTAALLVVLSSEESSDLPEELPSHRYARKVAFQIWSDKGKLLARSTTAPREPLTDQTKGFSDRRIDGRNWRIYSKVDERHHHRILVAESYEARNAVGKELAKHLLTPLIIALPTLAFGLVLLMRQRFKPLQRLASSISQRSPDRLDPIASTDVPNEIRPIIEQTNRLLQRVSDSMAQERRFTADAAHEIRTPLAVIRTYAQVAAAATEATERTRALNSVVQASDRATHLLAQLLTMARLDNDALTRHFVNCDLRKIAVDVIAEITPQALEKKVEVMLDEGRAAYLRGEPALLAVLLRNLIDNAVRYSPAETFVAVTIKHVDGHIRLTVSDQGPGIPEHERERVLSRFTRLGGSDAPGSGLGLSIALRIAQLHGATLVLQDGPGEYGLSVCASFREVAG